MVMCALDGKRECVFRGRYRRHGVGENGILFPLNASCFFSWPYSYLFLVLNVALFPSSFYISFLFFYTFDHSFKICLGSCLIFIHFLLIIAIISFALLLLRMLSSLLNCCSCNYLLFIIVCFCHLSRSVLIH